MAHDWLIVAERVGVLMNDFTRRVHIRSLDLPLIVSFFVWVEGGDPIVDVESLLPLPFRLNKLLLDAPARLLEHTVHRSDVLEIVELVGVAVVDWQWILHLQGQCLGRIRQKNVLAPHALTGVPHVVLLLLDDEFVELVEDHVSDLGVILSVQYERLSSRVIKGRVLLVAFGLLLAEHVVELRPLPQVIV